MGQMSWGEVCQAPYKAALQTTAAAVSTSTFQSRAKCKVTSNEQDCEGRSTDPCSDRFEKSSQCGLKLGEVVLGVRVL